MRALALDLRFALRTLRKSPAFSAAVILTLALGIGANTAIFSLIDAVILRTLPVKDPGQLFFVEAVSSRGSDGDFPFTVFEQVRDRNRTLQGVTAFDGTRLSASIDGQPEVLWGQCVTGNFFELLGVRATRGRTLSRRRRVVGSARGRAQPPILAASLRLGYRDSRQADRSQGRRVHRRRNRAGRLSGNRPGLGPGPLDPDGPVAVAAPQRPRLGRNSGTPPAGHRSESSGSRPGCDLPILWSGRLRARREAAPDRPRLGCAGTLGSPRRVFPPARRSDGSRLHRPPHRLRERREPHAGEGGVSTEGDRAADGHRSGTRAGLPSGVDREPRVRGGGRLDRFPRGRLGKRRPLAARLERADSRPPPGASRRAHPRVHGESLAPDRNSLRRGPGDARDADEPECGAQGDGRSGKLWKRKRPEAVSRGVPALPFRRPARGGRAPREESPRALSRGSGLRAGSRPPRARVPDDRRIRRRAGIGAVRETRGAAARDPGSASREPLPIRISRRPLVEANLPAEGVRSVRGRLQRLLLSGIARLLRHHGSASARRPRFPGGGRPHGSACRRRQRGLRARSLSRRRRPRSAVSLRER